MPELVELFKQLPECVFEYFRKNSTEKFLIYLQGFHDGGQFFVIDEMERNKPSFFTFIHVSIVVKCSLNHSLMNCKCYFALS